MGLGSAIYTDAYCKLFPLTILITEFRHEYKNS